MVQVEPLAVREFEAATIQSHLVQQRRMDVRYVVRILDGVEAQLICRAMDDAAFDAATREPDAEAVGMMVAPVRALRAGRAAKFRGEDNDGFVEQAAAFQVLKQASGRFVHLGGELGMVRFQSAMRVPRAGRAVAVLDLDEAYAALDEAARGQELGAKAFVSEWSRP